MPKCCCTILFPPKWNPKTNSDRTFHPSTDALAPSSVIAQQGGIRGPGPSLHGEDGAIGQHGAPQADGSGRGPHRLGEHRRGHIPVVKGMAEGGGGGGTVVTSLKEILGGGVQNWHSHTKSDLTTLT